MDSENHASADSTTGALLDRRKFLAAIATVLPMPLLVVWWRKNRHPTHDLVIKGPFEAGRSLDVEQFEVPGLLKLFRLKLTDYPTKCKVNLKFEFTSKANECDLVTLRIVALGEQSNVLGEVETVCADSRPTAVEPVMMMGQWLRGIGVTSPVVSIPGVRSADIRNLKLEVREMPS